MPEFSDTPASLDEFRSMRAKAGLSPFSIEATRVALENTLYGAWLRKDGALIGMGRLIGDGGMFAHVTDIAVDPAHQRQGHGGRIMANLMAWADTHLPTGCYISLIADPGAEALYQRHGFDFRTGMARTVP